MTENQPNPCHSLPSLQLPLFLRHFDFYRASFVLTIFLNILLLPFSGWFRFPATVQEMIIGAAMKCTAAVEPLVPPFPDCRLHLYCPRLAANQGPLTVFSGVTLRIFPHHCSLESIFCQIQIPDLELHIEARLLSRVTPLLN